MTRPPPIVIHLNRGPGLAPARRKGTHEPRPVSPALTDLGPPADKTPEPLEGAPIRIAHSTLRGRLKERAGGFWLDGSPATLDEVMRETNRVRKAHCKKPVGKNPAWFV